MSDDAPQFETVRYRVEGAVATITLARPDKANAMSMQLIDEVDAAFSLAGADAAVRVVVLDAEGRNFCSGHDLAELVGPDADPAIVAERATAEGKFAQEKRMYVDRCVRIYEFPKPTIAAVQGRCIAAGLMLALVCDLVVAADDASFANPVARMSGMGVELLLEPWDLGIRKAKEFLWTGEPLGAADAAAAGMVNRVVPRAALADAARALAETIALVPPVTAERIKDSVNHTYELMGKRQSWQYHFMAHHFTHNTATALGMLAERQDMGSMREVFDARDRGDAPAS